jgi:hypothetical protein
MMRKSSGLQFGLHEGLQVGERTNRPNFDDVTGSQCFGILGCADSEADVAHVLGGGKIFVSDRQPRCVVLNS